VTGLARLDRDCAKDLARGSDCLVVMSTPPAAFDVRENTPGNVKMAASLDFLHFHHIGWKSFPAGRWKSWKPPFPNFHISTPYGGPACPGHGRPARP
jgi:hypothetical protein